MSLMYVHRASRGERGGGPIELTAILLNIDHVVRVDPTGLWDQQAGRTRLLARATLVSGPAVILWATVGIGGIVPLDLPDEHTHDDPEQSARDCQGCYGGAVGEFLDGLVEGGTTNIV